MSALNKEGEPPHQQRNAMDMKDVRSQEKDFFNETLLRHLGQKLDATECGLFKSCRKSMNDALEAGRSGDVGKALNAFGAVEKTICEADLSLLCKLLIGTFYSSGLAYLRVKGALPKEADALSLQALAIDNFLIQEYGIEVMELHRVQQIVNLARIQMKIGRKDAAFDLLFTLIRCFEHNQAMPPRHPLKALLRFREKYPAPTSAPLPVGPFSINSQIEKVYEAPIGRFKTPQEDTPPSAIDSLFLLDFSSLTFDVVQKMFEDIIIEFARFTQELTPKGVGDVLSRYGFHTVDNLENYQAYGAAHLFLVTKIHAANGAYSDFLKALKARGLN